MCLVHMCTSGDIRPCMYASDMHMDIERSHCMIAANDHFSVFAIGTQ